MAVSCPPCSWPTVLEEKGPSDDPSILLAGIAHIGDAPIKIVAIRINSTLRPKLDCKPDVAESSYQAGDLDTVLGTVLEELEYLAAELGNLLGSNHLGAVELATGRYKVWAISSSFEP